MVDGAAGIGSGGPGQDSQAARTCSKIGGLAAEERVNWTRRVTRAGGT